MKTLVILSLDEVHRCQAADWADRMDLLVLSLNPHELTRDMSVDVVLCDWDYWSKADRMRILGWLRGMSSAVLVIVKGYAIPPGEAELLRLCGAKVQESWAPELFEQAGAVLAGDAAVDETREILADAATFQAPAATEVFFRGAAAQSDGDFFFPALDNDEELPQITTQSPRTGD